MPSSIEWTDETWNPVTGCTRVSPGCDHCYMYSLYPRLKGMGVHGYDTGPDDVRLLPERLRTPLSWKKPRRVFVNSMSDVFHPKVPFDYVLEMFLVMHEAASQRGHIFQILTKRPGRAVSWWQKHEQYFANGWPAHIWIGTSVESQKYAPRLTVLSRIPAPIRFVSAEPLLDQLDLTYWLEREVLHWVIVGGESGAGARKMDLNWARSLRDQSLGTGVAFFLKQLGGARNKLSGDHAILDGQLWQQYPTEKGEQNNAA